MATRKRKRKSKLSKSDFSLVWHDMRMAPTHASMTEEMMKSFARHGFKCEK